jgi:hypothetical protein
MIFPMVKYYLTRDPLSNNEKKSGSSIAAQEVEIKKVADNKNIIDKIIFKGIFLGCPIEE